MVGGCPWCQLYRQYTKYLCLVIVGIFEPFVNHPFGLTLGVTAKKIKNPAEHIFIYFLHIRPVVYYDERSEEKTLVHL